MYAMRAQQKIVGQPKSVPGFICTNATVIIVYVT
jgi:hypothetical protein